MKNLISPGTVIFAVAMAAFGILSLIYPDFVLGLEPVPAWVPGRLVLAYLSAVFLVAAGVSLINDKTYRLAAISLGIMLYFWVLVLHLPRLIAEPRSGGFWTGAAETLALGGAAWVLAGILQSEPIDSQKRNNFLDKMSLFGRFCFGISLPVFGILHFIYYEYVASVIPAWIPYPLFWAYFTGIAQIAAGVSIILNIKARLAAMLLSVMFGSWVLILHLPRAAANLSSEPEWTSLLVALAMCGGAWVIAGSLTAKNPAEDTDLSD
ncbi:MAG: DoxX family membrane protein [Pyrinomonadaceae bacterium]